MEVVALVWRWNSKSRLSLGQQWKNDWLLLSCFISLMSQIRVELYHIRIEINSNTMLCPKCSVINCKSSQVSFIHIVPNPNRNYLRALFIFCAGLDLALYNKLGEFHSTAMFFPWSLGIGDWLRVQWTNQPAGEYLICIRSVKNEIAKSIQDMYMIWEMNDQPKMLVLNQYTSSWKLTTHLYFHVQNSNEIFIVQY